MESLREKYVENTRRALLEAGTRLFVERDYADITAEELARAARLTRGALYHHFDGKRGLFETVFEDFESQAAHRIRSAIDSATDPFERANRGIEAFLDVCSEEAYRHVVLLQGPLALGWQRWRELDHRHLGGLVLDAVQALLDTAAIQPRPAELIARAFYGALTELSWAIAETDNPDRTRDQAASLMHDLVGGLLVGTDTHPSS